MSEKVSKVDSGSGGASFSGGNSTNVSSAMSSSDNKTSLLQKQMSINKIAGLGSFNNTCTGSKADEIEVIESGNCQPRHPKVIFLEKT